MNFSHLTLVVTEQCNLRCSYCFESHERTYGSMDEGTFKRAIMLLNEEKGKKSITFFGGEPLLYWDKIVTWINWIKKFYPDIDMSMTTNGLLLTKDIYAEILKNHVTVLFSIDGYGDIANESRKDYLGNTVWSTWINNISKIEYKNLIKIRMTITPNNVNYLLYSIKKFVEMGITNIAFAMDYYATWKREDIEKYKSEYIKVITLFKEYYKNGNHLHIDIIERLLHSGIEKQYTKCRIVYDSLTIMPNGDLKICHRANNSVANIKMDKFKLKDVLMKYAQWPREMNGCSECQLNKRCSLCVYLSHSVSEEKKALICEINKFHIMVVDKMISDLYNDQNKNLLNEFYYS